VEDQPLTIESFKRALEHLSNFFSWNFIIKSAKNCDTAFHEIKKAAKATPFDLVILDINIPPSKDKKILSGEDLGLELKKTFPNIKIIVVTALHNNFRLNNILKSLNPEGFIIKSEIDFKDLLDAINCVLTCPPYYSNSILKLMRRHISNNFVLDEIDRQLLYQLSIGTKNKDLTKFINLSKGGIERRKRHLKEMFNVENGDDRILLERASEQGFL